MSIYEQVMEKLKQERAALDQLHQSGKVLWECFWCKGESTITADGSMHAELFNKVICSTCLDKNDRYMIVFGSGLRIDGKPPVFQLALFSKESS